MSEENGNQIPSADAIQGIIGTLMSNPELMKNIIGMLGNQNGEDDGIGEEEVAEESAAENSAAEEAAISTPSVPSVQQTAYTDLARAYFKASDASFFARRKLRSEKQARSGKRGSALRHEAFFESKPSGEH